MSNELLPLDRISCRFLRDGKWQSLYIAELKFITDEEIVDLAWGDKLVETLQQLPNWRHSESSRIWEQSDA